jgi:hypothetical protein
MGFLAWLKRSRSGRLDPRVGEWRRAWSAAIAGEDGRSVVSLAASLDAMGLADDEIEIEREMLDGLRELIQLRHALGSDGLPVLQTGHRVIGTERCHFTAPVSMPDDTAQPAGRLLMTTSRAIFMGGARTTTVPWHAIGEVLHNERDIVLIRKDRDNLYRFRCNSFADAMCGAYLARHLSARPSGHASLPKRT